MIVTRHLIKLKVGRRYILCVDGKKTGQTGRRMVESLLEMDELLRRRGVRLGLGFLTLLCAKVLRFPGIARLAIAEVVDVFAWMKMASWT